MSNEVELFKKELEKYEPNLKLRLYYSSPEKYGEKIRELRRTDGFSQEELGKKLNITKQAVSEIEQGKRKYIDIAIFNELSKIFHCTPDCLLGYTNAKDKNLSILERFLIENPNSKYKKLKIVQELKENYPDLPELHISTRPFYFISDDLQVLKEKLMESTKNDVEALRLCIRFLELPKFKRENLKNILENIFYLSE